MVDSVIAAIGDSYGYSPALGLVSGDFYSRQLEQALLNLGATVRCRNFHVAGNTTAQMLIRIVGLTTFEIPILVHIYGGANDLAAATTVASAASASQFTVQTGFGTNYIAGTYVLVGGTQSSLISNITTDTITVSTPLSGTPINGTAIAIDTQANLTAMGNYVIAAGCARIVIGLMHYLNFSSGGDTVGNPVTSYLALRTLQRAAATALGAQIADFWSVMAGKIGGSETFTYFNQAQQLEVSVSENNSQGSHSWHVSDSNTHLNRYGNSILSTTLLSTIQSQPEWCQALGIPV